MVAFLGFFLVSNYTESRLWTDNELMTIWFVYVMVHTNVLTRKAATMRRRPWGGGPRSGRRLRIDLWPHLEASPMTCRQTAGRSACGNFNPGG
jgi:hypothetical protein